MTSVGEDAVLIFFLRRRFASRPLGEATVQHNTITNSQWAVRLESLLISLFTARLLIR